MDKKTEDTDLFQSIFESSVEGILVVDSAGIIIKANPASEQLFGYDSGELITQKVENLIPKKFKRITYPIEKNIVKSLNPGKWVRI